MISVLWRGTLLSAVADGRDNNFNLIRMIAASCVLVSHAYPIAAGSNATQPLELLLSGMTLGAVAVYVFFGLSGFLIFRSYDRSPDFVRYWAARFLRLFPALLAALAVTVLVGSILTTATQFAYWQDVPGHLLRNATLVSSDYDLPGIFENNPYPDAINGSLWTLRYEFACYILAFVVGWIVSQNQEYGFKGFIICYTVFFAYISIADTSHHAEKFAELSFPFVIGMAFYRYRDRVYLSFPLMAISGGAAIISSFTEMFEQIFILLLLYAVFVLAYLPGGVLRYYRRLGDYSYGVYVYAFPVQQLMAYHGATQPLENMAMAFPVTILPKPFSNTHNASVPKSAKAWAQSKSRPKTTARSPSS